MESLLRNIHGKNTKAIKDGTVTTHEQTHPQRHRVFLAPSGEFQLQLQRERDNWARASVCSQRKGT